MSVPLRQKSQQVLVEYSDFRENSWPNIQDYPSLQILNHCWPRMV